MGSKKELLMSAITDTLRENLDRYLELDETEIADTVAIQVISEIQTVLQADYFYYDPNQDYDEEENKNKNTDFDIVEQIVRIFEKYNLDAGNCHDFG